jgi:hypothetical protein
MDFLFFAYANDRDHSLTNLEREDEAIYSLMAPRVAKKHFSIHRDSYADLEKVAEFLTLYRRDIVLFHFSGHADSSSILLEDDAAYTRGIAELLGQCPRLKVVILNGCSTFGQVELLLRKQVPVVIATYAPVGDTLAAEFAIQFYRSLLNQENVQQSFEHAMGKVLAKDEQIQFYRAAVPQNPSNNQSAIWGIFYAPGQEETLQWVLPTGDAVAELEGFEDYEPNAILLDALLESLAPYSQEIGVLRENESLGVLPSILDKREAILKCLPHPISEQIRKLLVPESQGGAGVFYDKLGLPRLTQMTSVYDTLIELMSFILLAQLWDALSEKGDKLRITEAESALIKAFFSIPAPERRAYNFFPLIAGVRGILDQNELPYFVRELKYLSAIFQAGDVFYEACQFMESTKKQLAEGTLSQAEVKTLCMLAEENLAKIMDHLGFIAKYAFASVKNIDVIKHRHIKLPRFKHTVVKLVQRFVGLAEEPQLLDQYLDTTSVLLSYEEGGKPVFLNLTPFIIDENAFDDKASIAKLHYFDRYNREQDAYVFRHIYKPGDHPLIIGKQSNYIVIKAQFDAFAQLLFNHPMKQVV